MSADPVTSSDLAPPNPKPRKVLAEKERHGLLLVNTGPGKGKSTAAFGMAMRAAGHGMKAEIVQFIKGSRTYGELASLEKLGIPVIRAGEGFTWEVRSDTRQQELAAWGLARAAEALARNVDLLVLDEINVALGKGFTDVDAFLALLATRHPDTHVVCTGRYAPDALIAAADLVTRFELVKHPYELGLRAQPGVEF
jgi:cob(I)alamin adenosyltransferase